MDLAPSTNVTFTITSLPKSDSGMKTLRRVMKMQPNVQRVLTKLAKLRDRANSLLASGDSPAAFDARLAVLTAVAKEQVEASAAICSAMSPSG